MFGFTRGTVRDTATKTIMMIMTGLENISDAQVYDMFCTPIGTDFRSQEGSANRGGLESTSGEENHGDTEHRQAEVVGHDGAHHDNGTNNGTQMRASRKNYMKRLRNVRNDGTELLCMYYGVSSNDASTKEGRLSIAVDKAIVVKQAYDVMVATGEVPEYLRRSRSSSRIASPCRENDAAACISVTFTSDEVNEVYRRLDGDDGTTSSAPQGTSVDPARCLKEQLMGMVHRVCDAKALLTTAMQTLTRASSTATMRRSTVGGSSLISSSTMMAGQAIRIRGGGALGGIDQGPFELNHATRR